MRPLIRPLIRPVTRKQLQDMTDSRDATGRERDELESKMMGLCPKILLVKAEDMLSHSEGRVSGLEAKVCVPVKGTRSATCRLGTAALQSCVHCLCPGEGHAVC